MGRPLYPPKLAKCRLERTILCSTVKHNPRSCCLANNANEVSVAYTRPQHNSSDAPPQPLSCLAHRVQQASAISGPAASGNDALPQ